MNPAWDGGVLREAWTQRLPPWVRLLDRAPKSHELALGLDGRLGPHEELGENPVEVLVQVGKPFMGQDEALVSMHQSWRAIQATHSMKCMYSHVSVNYEMTSACKEH